MGVHQFMLGRELPCTVMDLLEVRLMPLPGATHDALVEQVESGRAYPDVLYRLGLSHLGRQELGLARQRLSAAVELKPAYAPARLALAAACDLLALHSEAADQLDAVIAAFDAGKVEGGEAVRLSIYQVLCAAGFCLERVGAPGSAAYRYEQALAYEQADLFAHHRLAAIYAAHDQLNEAVEHHRAILNTEPQDQAVRTSLAHLLQLLERHNEAVWEYEKALCLDPDNWDLQMELTEQFERMGDSDAAIVRLQTLCEKSPQFPDLHLRLANLYSTRGDDTAAMREFARALGVHPGYLECHIAMARHELKMGRSEDAAEHFQRALSINNQNLEAYGGLAVALNRLGNLEQAKEMLAAAMKIGGNSDVLVAQLGELEISEEAASEDVPQFEGSAVHREDHREWVEGQIARYEAMLAEHPSWVDARVRYGMLLKLLGRTDEAVAALDAATRENPAYVEAWMQLALARRRSGDESGAMAALEQVVQIRPETAELHYRLGLIYCSDMEFDLAMERMEFAVRSAGSHEDLQRQVWVALNGLSMSGSTKTGKAQGTRDEMAKDSV